MHDAVARIERHDLALQYVSGGIGRGDVKQRIPASDVGPAEMSGNDGHAIGLFHHGVVDRFLRRARECLRLQPYKAKIVGGARNRLADGRGDFGLQSLEFRQQDVGAEEKVAGIPEIAFAHIAGGCRDVRLFNECLHRIDAAVAEGLAGKNVAVARFRFSRLYSEGDDATGVGNRSTGKTRGVKGLDIRNDVIGREC